ncbi:MAG: hypothetical protein ACTTJY_01990 [Hoylesella shahii]|uniref:hypothetical protein n=1 Tax=Hoylesella shahii TaxID=228603 RepID=UPI003F9EE7E1
MLHTIKKLSVFAIVAIVAMAFSACSSDEEQPAVLQQLLGKWQPVTRSYTEASANTNTYEIWYKDLTWDRHQTIEGENQLTRKGAFHIENNIIWLRSTNRKGHDVVILEYKFEVNGDNLTLIDIKTQAVTQFKRIK